MKELTTFIQFCLDKVPVARYLDAKSIIRDLYDMKLGVYFKEDKDPLASNLLHPKENHLLNSEMRDVIEEFAVLGLGDLWKISLVEYLTLPMPVFEILRGIKGDVVKARNDALKSLGVGKD